MLPAAKEKVRLRRGRLAVTGEVVWSRSGQAGLHFLSRVRVDDWLPTRANHVAQQRLDELLDQSRIDANSCSPLPICETAESGAIIASELAQLAMEIEALANDLADDPVVVGSHFSKLQTLDITAQVLRKLSGARS